MKNAKIWDAIAKITYASSALCARRIRVFWWQSPQKKRLTERPVRYRAQNCHNTTGKKESCQQIESPCTTLAPESKVSASNRDARHPRPLSFNNNQNEKPVFRESHSTTLIMKKAGLLLTGLKNDLALGLSRKGRRPSKEKLGMRGRYVSFHELDGQWLLRAFFLFFFCWYDQFRRDIVTAQILSWLWFTKTASEA